LRETVFAFVPDAELFPEGEAIDGSVERNRGPGFPDTMEESKSGSASPSIGWRLTTSILVTKK
jgi:hypothetical protein